MKRFVPTYLDPASRLGEILFGLIMVLTVTLTAGLTVAEGRAGVRQLLIAAIGCNIAWGIIDAVMYIMNCVTVRSGKIRFIQAVQATRDPSAALDLIENEIDPELQSLLDPNDAAALRESLLAHITRARIKKVVLTRDELLGAVACFWLVFVSCLPAAIPFFIFSRPHFALRVSNFLLLALMFLVGQKWARYAGTRPWVAGAALVAIGLVLVGIAILLGRVAMRNLREALMLIKNALSRLACCRGARRGEHLLLDSVVAAATTATTERCSRWNASHNSGICGHLCRSVLIVLGLAVSQSLGGTVTDVVEKTPETEQAAWEYSVSTSVYVPLHSQDYANPIITADHDWLHIEARYNYEALKTGSLWLGYNFSFGEKLEITLTPMLGGVFGNTTGIAPGYTITASYGPIEFFTQGEYLFDVGTSSE